MDLSRREFLVISGVFGAGVGLSSLGLDLGPVKAYADELKIDKMKAAKHTTSICPYCSVGCGLIVSTDTKAGKIINIEGDPDHPINEGSLVRQRSGSVPDHGQQSRIVLTKVLYRAPFSDKWERKALGLGHHGDRQEGQGHARRRFHREKRQRSGGQPS